MERDLTKVEKYILLEVILSEIFYLLQVGLSLAFVCLWYLRSLAKKSKIKIPGKGEHLMRHDWTISDVKKIGADTAEDNAVSCTKLPPADGTPWHRAFIEQLQAFFARWKWSTTSAPTTDVSLSTIKLVSPTTDAGGQNILKRGESSERTRGDRSREPVFFPKSSRRFDVHDRIHITYDGFVYTEMAHVTGPASLALHADFALEVFEEACARRRLDPKTHKLMHRRNPVDLSTPFKYSGLTNHATLELVACDEGETGQIPSEISVSIAIRLEDGHRVAWSGPSKSTIWSILESVASNDEKIAALLKSAPSGSAPTIVYIQNQFVGEKVLRETTLESLGIRDSALFQLHRTLSASTQIEPKDSSSSAPIAAPSPPVPEGKISASSSPPPKKPPPVPTLSVPEPTPSNPVQEHHLPHGESPSLIFPSVSGGGGADSGASYTAEPFSVFGSRPSKSMFDPDQPTGGQPDKSPTLGEIVGITLEPEGKNSFQQDEAPQQLREFKFPSETQGQNLRVEENEGEISKAADSLCEREEVLFQRQTSSSLDTDSEKLPDEFFQLTENDLRLIISSLRKEAGRDGFLGERSVEKSAKSRLIERCPRCIIHFLWSDEFILQACFKPQERVSALYDFIRDQLVDTSLPFQLFTTPPRVILSNTTETLIQAELFPTARVHITTEHGPPKAREVLRKDLLKNLKSSAEASTVISKWVPKSRRS